MWVLTTLNTRFCSLRIVDSWIHPNNNRTYYGCFVWTACTELKNEFANSENVLYKRCFVMFETVGRKLTFLN